MVHLSFTETQQANQQQQKRVKNPDKSVTQNFKYRLFFSYIVQSNTEHGLHGDYLFSTTKNVLFDSTIAVAAQF